ncbi:hypothetical protein MWH28_03015 [Natroniella sulfidigena]|uniref:hypothetical protein n=1 Tax=Natroniella sulfidigena TaxID=723921 RepID=UPI00200A61A9|nr:hypothetical protein [Natroniella sulfidigena]MCK8816334.1 hypothetical protein [Natroniella sulfidigena]
MKKLAITCLIVMLLMLQMPLALAATDTLEVAESELIQLAGQQKFETLTEMIEKLVYLNLAEEIEEEEEVKVIDFGYIEDDQLKIYYQLN